MPRSKALGFTQRLERFSQRVSVFTGTSTAFLGAVSVILIWVALGPVFRFSDTWQLVINTGTTIVTFLMVFLIQRSQNKEARALELKLDEIVAALQGASNRLINVEDLSEDELDVLRAHYHELADLAKKESSLTESHSIEEAAQRHVEKSGGAVHPRAQSRGRKSANESSRRS